ncbi:MAG: DUF2784 domain-containing protein [Elusimicrobia bacterium]|nr:DUF2784 domain-containing protein [Elusimicrobiota bacterium]
MKTILCHASDLILAVHTLWIACIVFPAPLIVIGKLRGWRWVRVRWLRLAHLAMMAIVTLESVFAVTCPLTSLENLLRQKAGLSGYDETFVSIWLSRLIYHDLPPFAFLAAYVLFMAGLVALYLWAPPHGKSMGCSEN